MSFFGLIGLGICLYGCFYTFLSMIFDCDVRLGFLEKFGKSARRLKGKVAFITGASSGIGEHTAYALAKAGVKLILTARRSVELQRVKKQCIVVSNGQLEEKDILVIPMDVLELSSHKTHFQHAVRHFGHVDILINNAGRSQRAKWENIDIKVDRQIFELDVFSVINLSKVALEHFNQRGEGHLVVVSSIGGIVGSPFSGSYTGAKHAIHGYFNGLRAEKLGTQIHVTILCPGSIFTNLLSESFTGKDGEKHGGSTKPTDRRMTAERCGHLNAVAIANKVEDAWMGLFPLMPIVYMFIYFPILSSWGTNMLGPQFLSKLRDSKAFTDPKEMRKTG